MNHGGALGSRSASAEHSTLSVVMPWSPKKQLGEMQKALRGSARTGSSGDGDKARKKKLPVRHTGQKTCHDERTNGGVRGWPSYDVRPIGQ